MTIRFSTSHRNSGPEITGKLWLLPEDTGDSGDRRRDGGDPPSFPRPVISLCADSRGRAPGLLAGPVLLAVAGLLAWLTKTFAEDTPRLAPSIARPAWRSL